MTETTTETPVRRGPGRPRLRPEPAASPLRDRLKAKIATVKDNATADRFFIPPEMIPEGVSVEWKKYSVYGQEDPYYIANMRTAGWEPMTDEDFPELVPEGYKGPIIKDGQMLMGRAAELTERAHAKSRQVAKQQIADREALLGMTPKGTLPRTSTDLNGKRLGVSQEMVMPIAIEE